MITEIDESVFGDKIKGTCMVDFFATWCPPCKMLAPVLEKVSGEYESKLDFYKINVDENNNVAKNYQIMSVPTLVIFKNGSPVKKVSGYMGEKELMKFIDQVL